MAREYKKTKERRLRDAAEAILWKPEHEDKEKAKVVLHTLDFLAGTEGSPLTLTTEKKK